MTYSLFKIIGFANANVFFKLMSVISRRDHFGFIYDSIVMLEAYKLFFSKECVVFPLNFIHELVVVRNWVMLIF